MLLTDSETHCNQATEGQSSGTTAEDPVPSTSPEPPSYADATGHPSRRARSNLRNASHARATNRDTITLTPTQEQRMLASQTAIAYKFVTKSFNSMVLMFEPATLPLYYISTHMNCFIPSSYITVIRRGDSESGEFIGQFEMGISVKKSTVLIDGKEKVTDAVLSKSKHKSVRTWLWRWDSDESTHLSWTYDSPVKYCYGRTNSDAAAPPLLATYTPPPLIPRDGRPSPVPILKVHPGGHPLFDHILISALIIERKRLTPGSAIPVMSWSV